MAAGKNAAKSRRSAKASRPLTEAQVAEVCRLALSMRGAARSVKLHGVIVYLDTKGGPQLVASPEPNTPAGAQASDGTAPSRKPDDGLNAKKRRSRRRLEERIDRRAVWLMSPPRPGHQWHHRPRLRS